MTDHVTASSSRIYAAMSEVMKAVGHIAKGRSNKQQGYQFRGIDDIYAALQGPLVAAGVFCVPRVIESTVVERESKSGGTLIYTTLKVSHVFYAADGSYVEAVTVGEAMDSGDKSSNKAMSAALKYAMIETFCIPTEGDNDSENHTHEVAPRPKQQAAVQSKAPAATSTTPSSPSTTTPEISDDAIADVYKEVAEMTGHLSFVKFLWSDIKDRGERYRIYEELAKILDEIDRRMGTALASKLIATVFNSNGWDDQKPTEVAARKVITALRATVSTGEVPLTMKAATVPADPYDSNEPPF